MEDGGFRPRRSRVAVAAGWAVASTLLACALTAGCSPDDDAATPAPGDREPGFVEVSEAAGLDFHMSFLPGEQGELFKINLYDHGAGVIVGDADGDGFDDIYFLNQLGANALFTNQGDGTFKDVTERAGVALADRICTSASFADMDNDGDQDLFVASTRGGNVLYRNDGTGRFEDVTAAAGVSHVGHTQGVTFFDYDGDGFLDLFVTNTAAWTLDQEDPEGRYHIGPGTLQDLVGSPREPNIFYRNDGDGTFTDVTATTGVAGDGWGGDVAVFDFDADGDPDLFVTNMFGASTLYRNDEGKRFTDVTRSVLGRTSWGAVGCRVLDHNSDGLLDLLIVDMHSDMWMASDSLPGKLEEARKYGGPEGPLVEDGSMSAGDAQAFRERLLIMDDDDLASVLFGNTLFTNLGSGQFEEASDRAGVETLWPWGIATADYDLDGHEDAFVANGMGYPYGAWHNDLLMNSGDGTFAHRHQEEGISPRPGGPYLLEKIGNEPAARSSRSAAVIDFDVDGRPDLVVNNFNERPYLYRNQFPERHWLALRLRGTTSNRDAIGAVVTVTVGGSTQVRQVTGASGYLGQSTLTVHFGLGAADSIDDCRIRWPSGATQTFVVPAIDRLHEVLEAAE